MVTKEGCRYKKRTISGYFLLGVIAFGVGVVYGLYEDADLYSSLMDNFDFLFNNLRAILFAVASSIVFYWLFFFIKNKIEDIATEYDKEGKKVYKLNEEELIGLRDCYLKIKKDKSQTTNEQIKEEDILAVKAFNDKEDHIRKALVRWWKLRKIPQIVAWGYMLVIAIIFLIVVGDDGKGRPFLNFFVPYTLLFSIPAIYYAILFYTLRIKSFMRLSYSVLYPTILTIAVNIYFGLSINELCAESFSCSTYCPIFIYASFFLFTAAFELLSYKKWKRFRQEKISTNGFVMVSILALAVSIFIFFMSTRVWRKEEMADAFSNLLFAIALALYLGIFEGWDSLRNMNIDEGSLLFAKHYRWWNFLQICYPLVFFFLMDLVKSEIFTFGLMIAFTIVSIVSTVVWKQGGEKKAYSETKWGMRKVIFGLTTVVLVFANRLLVMNENIKLKTPPCGLNADAIDVELIVLLLGALNGMFVFWGVKGIEQRKFVLMALPLKEVKNYQDFIDFCRYGFIYDFCNYIYLIYILIVHVLLFSTGLLPKDQSGLEDVSTILIILMVIVYMVFSFKAKFTNNGNYQDESSRV